MNMSGVYQPLIIKYLLDNKGKATQEELTKLLALNDKSTLQYFKKILMRWPYKTLSGHHNIISYDKTTKLFTLNVELDDSELIRKSLDKCLLLFS